MSHPSIQPKLGQTNYVTLRRHLAELRDQTDSMDRAAGIQDAIAALDRMWHSAVIIADHLAEHYEALVEAELAEERRAADLPDSPDRHG